MAPEYLSELFFPLTADHQDDIHSILASSNQLNVPSVKLSTYRACAAFSCSGHQFGISSQWNKSETPHQTLLACDILRHSCLLVISIPATPQRNRDPVTAALYKMLLQVC